MGAPRVRDEAGALGSLVLARKVECMIGPRKVGRKVGRRRASLLLASSNVVDSVVSICLGAPFRRAG